MIDFIVKYWIEFLFGLIISGMGVMAKLMYNQHLKNKAIDKGSSFKKWYRSDIQ